jgi:GNAT superfamily N-acetyltransferase
MAVTSVEICDLNGPDGLLLPAMAVITAVVAEQRGGLRPLAPERELARRRIPDPACEATFLVAGEPSDPDGVAEVAIELESNAHVAHIDIWVPEGRRRRGTGSVLLAAAEDRVRAAGRTLAMAQVDSPAPSGRAFFEAHGYAAALSSLCNRVLLDDVDRSLLDDWTAHPDPAYDLLLVEGTTPDHLVKPQLEAMAGINDAPIGDLEVEDEHFTAERLEAMERAVAASGQRRCTYLAIHRPTGQGAGFTTVRWDPEEPRVLWQRGTAVTRAHRGHRLGQRMKAAMLRHLLGTVEGAVEVRTENAGTNAHMLAINDALGFAPWAEEVVLQKHL